MPNNKKNPKTRTPSVEETNAELDKEFSMQDSKMEELPFEKGNSNVLEMPMQSSSSVTGQVGEIISDGTATGSDGRPLPEPKGTYFPADSHGTDENARKFLSRLSCDSEKRFQNPSLLLEDLKGLGKYGELSEDQNHVTMPFKDVHHLVTTMRLTEIILNERIQNKRKVKLELLKAQLDAGYCDNIPALLVELERAKAALAQKYSFHSVGMFGDEPVIDLEGIVYFETLLIARTINWLATLSIDPDSETRRGTLAVFSELQAAYSTQSSLHELYFHQHDDRKLLEKRIRGAMSDVGERLTRVAVAECRLVAKARTTLRWCS
jgi:hypothetical protein